MSNSYFIDAENAKILSYYKSNGCKNINDLLLDELDGQDEIIDFIQKHANIRLDTTYVTSTAEKFNIQKLDSVRYASILNLKKINDIRFINKFFEAVNVALPNSGLYFGKVITHPNRRKAIFKKYPPIINKFIYLMDYIFTRVLPKLKITKRIYFYLTKGKGRVISRAETYGRLYACGFEIIDEKTIKNSLYFVAKKIKEPTYDKDPSYGPLIRLQRIGKNGKKIRVFKFRTMHPFSEYLQEFVYNTNQLEKGGKIKNDFRVSPEGRILRKFWIDELPMLLNILRGDIKLVGVRPLSAHFFSLYDSELQQLRTQTKPGFIPPFYVDLPETIDEIMASERKYLMSYQKAPFITDIKYFFKSFQNVLFRGARSN